jgi:hypothetical protein
MTPHFLLAHTNLIGFSYTSMALTKRYSIHKSNDCWKFKKPTAFDHGFTKRYLV